MTTQLEAQAWPFERLGEAIDAVARAGGLLQRVSETPVVAGIDAADEHAVALWIDHAALQLGIEAEASSLPYKNLTESLEALDVALVRVPGQTPPSFLAVVRRSRRTLACLAPDRTLRRVNPSAIATILATAAETPHRAEVDALLDAAAVPSGRRDKARRALLHERLGATAIEGVWSLRLPPNAPIGKLAAEARLGTDFILSFLGHTTAYALLIFAWWAAGRGMLLDRLDRGWFLAWAVLLVTIVPFRMMSMAAIGRFLTGAGALLKRRLLTGALALRPEETRVEGVGRLLGRILEGEIIEELALHGGIVAVTGIIELFVTGFVLLQGAGGILHLQLLVFWCVIAAVVGHRFIQLRRSWTETRLAMTHDLVERMVGHRTRLAQEPRSTWHTGEDELLDVSLARALRMDKAQAWLFSLPRGWIFVGALGLVPVLLSAHASLVSMAIAIGGIWLGYGAFERISVGLGALAGTRIGWEQVAPLFHAGGRSEPTPPLPPPRLPDAAGEDERTVLEAHEIVFRHRPGALPVVRGASLRIAARDRILLEGPSGGGKSTLSALLTGLREPESGLLLLDGFDRGTWGASGWRRRVAAAPQFHENHVLLGSFAFNLLMGRRWPPLREDLAEAEAVCRELGLGPLLSRMPGGFEQLVGETGWQLSHGEKSRLYMARALLQGGDVVVLDESFAALDPETLERALRCVIERAPALVVVAHP